MRTTRLTCVGSGTTLTSLREGRRYVAAFLRRVAALVTAVNHPQTSEWGGVLITCRIIDECPRQGKRLVMHVIHYKNNYSPFSRPWGPWTDAGVDMRGSGGGQRWRSTMSNHCWWTCGCAVPAVWHIRHARTSSSRGFGTSVPVQLYIIYKLISSIDLQSLKINFNLNIESDKSAQRDW